MLNNTPNFTITTTVNCRKQALDFKGKQFTTGVEGEWDVQTSS